MAASKSFPPPARRPTRALMDTGSSDLWVYAESCEGCGHHKRYDSAASKSYSLLGKAFSIDYGSGAVSGFEARETVSLAGELPRGGGPAGL